MSSMLKWFEAKHATHVLISNNFLDMLAMVERERLLSRKGHLIPDEASTLLDINLLPGVYTKQREERTPQKAFPNLLCEFSPLFSKTETGLSALSQ